MIFIFLNLMITILSDSLSKIRENNWTDDNDPDLIDYIKSKMIKFKFYQQKEKPVYGQY